MSETADIIVVGCGAAGLSAAIEAADRGARALVLESEAQPAGSTRLSAGHCVFCETDLEPGSKAELYADLLHAHHHVHDEALVRLYVDRAPTAYARLKELGLVFGKSLKLAHMTRAWAHEMAGDVQGGLEIGRLLERAARKRGVRILTATRARRLRRGADGRVAGVEVDQDGKAATLGAERAVILASGGFTRNPDLIRNFGAAGSDRIFALTGQGSRGDGLIMAMGLGADTSFMTIGIAPTTPADPVSGKGVLINYSGAVLLNREGRRFCDESWIYNDISAAALRQDDPTIIQIYDAAIRDDYSKTMWGRVLTGYAEYRADDLDGLLAQIEGLNRVQARASVDSYNAGVKAGSDPAFGRRHLVGSSGTPVAIDKPPYYGLVTVPGTTHFNGGLKVDGSLRVIDVFGSPINGLFAAGEVVGGFHGNGYLSGTHVGMALIFGQIAGQNASLDGLSL